MWIVELALRRPYTFIVAALLIVLATPYGLSRMTTNVFPAIDMPVIAQLWEYRGLTAKKCPSVLPGQDGTLLPGAYAEIQFTLTNPTTALLIPPSVLLINAKGPQVVVLTKTTASNSAR